MLMIICYSLTGKTAALASQLSQILGAECRLIEDVKPRRGIWGFIRSGYESTFGKQPPIKPFVPEITQAALESCDGVILMSPVWAGTISSPMNTFLHRYRAGIRRYALLLVCGDQTNSYGKGLSDVQKICGIDPVYHQTFCCTAPDIGQQLERAGRSISDLLEKAGT